MQYHVLVPADRVEAVYEAARDGHGPRQRRGLHYTRDTLWPVAAHELRSTMGAMLQRRANEFDYRLMMERQRWVAVELPGRASPTHTTTSPPASTPASPPEAEEDAAQQLVEMSSTDARSQSQPAPEPEATPVRSTAPQLPDKALPSTVAALADSGGQQMEVRPTRRSRLPSDEHADYQYQ